MAPKKPLQPEAVANMLFKEHSPIEEILRTGTTIILLLFVIFHASVFGSTYPERLQLLYMYPWWRMLVVGLVGLGAWWCPRVGLALALVVFFYFNTMAALSNR